MSPIPWVSASVLQRQLTSCCSRQVQVVRTRNSPSAIVWVVLGLETALAAKESADIDTLLITVFALAVVELFLRSKAGLSNVLNELGYHTLVLTCSMERQLTRDRLAVVVRVVGLRHDERLDLKGDCLLGQWSRLSRRRSVVSQPKKKEHKDVGRKIYMQESLDELIRACGGACKHPPRPFVLKASYLGHGVFGQHSRVVTRVRARDPALSPQGKAK